MAPGISTKPTRVHAARGYLAKAEAFLAGATREQHAGNHDAAAVLAVHAVISACDAICAKLLQLRHSGADHAHAITLLQDLPLPKHELRSKARQARRVLDKKNLAEYEDRRLTPSETASMLQDSQRFLAWVRTHLPPTRTESRV